MKKLNLETSRQSEHMTSRDWSKYGLANLRKSIDNKHLIDLKIRQQIKLQKQNSAKFVQKIKMNVHRTQQNAIEFVTKLEEEMQKNKYLVALVTHYESQIQKIKKQEYQNLMKNVQNSQYEQLCNQISYLEKQLGEQARKSNSAISQVQKKYQIVKAERRQRTVFSNMFNNFESELFNLELYYKQLVIQRVLCDKNYQKKVQEFEKINIQGLKNMKDYQEKVRDMRYKGQFQVQTLNKMENHSVFFRTRNKLTNPKLQKAQNYRQSQLIESQLRCFWKQKKVKQILYDFKVKNMEEFASVFKDISPYSRDITKMIQIEDNQISLLQERIKAILTEQRMKKSNQQEPSQQMKNLIKRKKYLKRNVFKYIKTDQNIKRELQILKSSQSFNILTKIIGTLQGSENEDIGQVFIDLDKKLNQMNIKISKHNNSPMQMYKSRLVEQFQLRDREDSKIHFRSQSTMSNAHIENQKNLLQVPKIGKKLSINKLRIRQKEDQLHTQKRIQRNSLKKLSTMIKQAQSKTKNNFYLASKNQMIKYGLKAFQTEGSQHGKDISDFNVKYA